MRAAVRAGIFGVLLAATAVPAAAPPACVQAVEFPYYLYPQALWERELVWLKNIGIRTVEFSVPWNWHQVQAAEFDFTGRTSPRRDLAGFIRLLRKVGLQAWVRPLPPVADWPNRGVPAGASASAQRVWIREIKGLLEPQTAIHGGPVAFVEGKALEIDAAAPPEPVIAISAVDPQALARSREVLISRRGAVLWTDVEDKLYPAGWAPEGSALLRKGAVGLSGDEPGGAVALRRDAALMRNWSALFGALKPMTMPKPEAGKWPDGVSVAEVTSPEASAVSIVNRGKQDFHDDIKVFEPGTRRINTIPGVRVAAGQTLWLPVDVSLGQQGLCRECSNFSPAARIVYATAELLTIEYENGILAMEFAAPESGEAVLQLERKPVGPFLAAGKPVDFDWDDKTLRARLPIPANTKGDNHVRIGIAMEEPDASAFFEDAHRLIIGEKNVISTSYSSSDVAARSRLRLPEGFTATVKSNDENGIRYEVTVPANLARGDYANLALEADGMPLGRARLELFRPVSVRIMEAIQIHFGQHTELQPDPPIVPIEPKAGSDVEVNIRNNWPAIENFRVEAAGGGLEFFPPKNDIAIGAMDARSYSLRLFAHEGESGLTDWRLRVSGGGTMELPFRALLLPRGRTTAWTADLDGDGVPEWVLESPQARAIFSTQDGGRWIEFTWKETNTNFLPEKGAFAGSGAVTVRANGDTLEFTGNGWKRTARLAGAALTIEESPALPADGLADWRQGTVRMTVQHASPERAVYLLKTGDN